MIIRDNFFRGADTMSDWNPDLYLQFRSERTQPSLDLISRIDLQSPKSILDIGCGPGNSTQVLVQRWPGARVSGLDSSPAMIEKARADFPKQEWICGDAALFATENRYDLVFSNAVIQWLPDHPALLKRFRELLNPGGTLAVQIPLFLDMPLASAIRRAAADPRWSAGTADIPQLFTIHTASFYYDTLAKLFTKVSLWLTDYMHIMGSHMAILEMIRSTGLKPYLERINDPRLCAEFEKATLKQIEAVYPEQEDGKVILPFKRLFFISS